MGEDGRDELHIVGGNFIGGHPPVLRITELRNRHATGYLMIGRHIGERLIQVVNRQREQTKDTRSQIPTLKEIRAKKRTANGYQSVAEIIVAEDVTHDRRDIAAILEAKSWKVRRLKRDISVTPPGKTKSYRIPWETLFDQIDQVVRDLRNRTRDEHERGKERG